MRTVITAALALATLALAAPAGAAGPLYSLPSTPPPEADSGGFANSLNQGVPGLPAALGYSAEPSPEQVEARARLLERGVVVPVRPASGEAASRAEVLPPVEESSDPGREPLLVAFLAAAALALAGLALAARRRRDEGGLRSAG